MSSLPPSSRALRRSRSQGSQNTASMIAGIAAMITAVGGTFGLLVQTGVIGGHANPSATPPATGASPSPGGSATPSPSASASPEDSAGPSPSATPTPTPTPTATPTPRGGITLP